MAAITSSLTATAVLLHALLGCCWHHTHACAGTCPATPSALDDYDHAAPGPCTHCPGPSGHERPHPGKCHGPRCAFASGLAEKAPGTTLPWFRTTGPAAAAAPGEGSPQPAIWACAAGALHRAPSLRPHLLHRVLLL